VTVAPADEILGTSWNNPREKPCAPKRSCRATPVDSVKARCSRYRVPKIAKRLGAEHCSYRAQIAFGELIALCAIFVGRHFLAVSACVVPFDGFCCG
jgi:hypothetical protein